MSAPGTGARSGGCPHCVTHRQSPRSASRSQLPTCAFVACRRMRWPRCIASANICASTKRKGKAIKTWCMLTRSSLIGNCECLWRMCRCGYFAVVKTSHALGQCAWSRTPPVTSASCHKCEAHISTKEPTMPPMCLANDLMIFYAPHELHALQVTQCDVPTSMEAHTPRAAEYRNSNCRTRVIFGWRRAGR